jgi:hypothetical protein
MKNKSISSRASDNGDKRPSPGLRIGKLCHNLHTLLAEFYLFGATIAWPASTLSMISLSGAKDDLRFTKLGLSEHMHSPASLCVTLDSTFCR